ncbi:MAG: hypothetical protein K6T37_07950 [Acidothermus cellulolyticus]|nr:hypothetical protein [Acidothermus cellulolyticus]
MTASPAVEPVVSTHRGRLPARQTSADTAGRSAVGAHTDAGTAAEGTDPETVAVGARTVAAGTRAAAGTSADETAADTAARDVAESTAARDVAESTAARNGVRALGPAGRPALRRVPVPDPDPAFDDETSEEIGWETTALPFAAFSTATPPSVRSRAHLRLVPGGIAGGVADGVPAGGVGGVRAGVTGIADSVQAGIPAGVGGVSKHAIHGGAPASGSPSHLPPPRPWATQLAQAIAEIVTGTRPPQQLIRWTSLEVFEALRHRAASAARTTGSPALRPPARPAAAGPVGRAIVRSVRICEPTSGAVEVSAVVQYGPRCRAMAFRLDGINGRWRCTALQLG